MKLFEIAAGPDYIVYKVTSPKTDHVYYGYCTGDENDIERTFMTGAKRQNSPDRGDVRMINAAGGKENLNFDIIAVFTDEVSAFVERNDQRAGDSFSITGPTNFPGNIFRRAIELHPDRLKKWKIQVSINEVTARETMSEQFKDQAKFSHADLLALAKQGINKEDIKRDLDLLLYPAFLKKYFPHL